MQKVLLIGNLGRDPEVKYSQQGTAIAQFSVATTERWKDKDGIPQEHTEWFGVKAFNRLAEIAGEHLHKGSRLCESARAILGHITPLRLPAMTQRLVLGELDTMGWGHVQPQISSRSMRAAR